uniref:Protein kinase domain-containing protein n=1 Tax=Leersia perrieri TaxID=77586 RepID=A0A0D9WFE5_9ORYZ
MVLTRKVLIHAKKSSLQQQQQQQRSSKHVSSKAGWPNPSSSSSSPANPFGLPILLPPAPFKDWPPWLDMPPVQTPSPSPSPSPAADEPSASPPPEHATHAGSIALPPAAASTVRPEVTTPIDGENNNRINHGGGGWGRRRVTSYVVVVVAMAMAMGMVVVWLRWWRRGGVVASVRPWATGLSGQLARAFVTGVPALKRAELEAACEDFSNVIGEMPGYVMYKGTLSSGVEIAVVSTTKASPKDWSKRCEAHFRKKITSLSRVNHKNFVNLLGYCEEEQPFTRMMVFEYAPNGTLFDHLHARDEGHQLDWATRLRVAVGVAYCLEHMHQLSPPEIVRALDASTVYLTDDFAAKVSDVLFSSSGEAETAPMPDRESVVYGYGMLLLEIMSGRFTASEGGLVQGWAAAFLRGERRLGDVMDPALRGAFHGETVDRLDAVVRSCTERDPRRRPDMGDVARLLREITALPPDAATPRVSPLWWAELEIISTEAA